MVERGTTPGGNIYSEAWAKVIPVKVGDRVSVYISQPVPWGGNSQQSHSLCWNVGSSHLDVLILPDRHVVTGLPGPHGEQVGHHGAEPRGEAGLGDEAQLELGQTDDVVSLLPVPAGDVEQVGLVVVLHQLDDHLVGGMAFN